MEFDLGYTNDEVRAVGIACEINGRESVLRVVGEFQFLLIIHPASTSNRAIEPLDRAGACTAEADCDVAVSADGEIENEVIKFSIGFQDEVPALAGKGGWFSFVNRIAVSRDPFPGAAKCCCLVIRNAPRGGGADVQEIIGAGTAAVGEVLDDVAGRFVCEVGASNAPMGVHRLAHFTRDIFWPTLAIHGVGEGLLEGDAINLGVSQLAFTSDAGVVDDHGIGLVTADHFVEPIFLPIRLPRPVPIKPKSPDLAVVLAEELHGGLKIVQIFVELRLVAGVALPTPVEGGVVKEGDNTLRPASRDEFFNKVAASRRVEGIVLR